MSLFNSYNSHTIKLVYSGSFVNYSGQEFLLNGLLPIVNDYMLSFLKENKSANYYSTIQELRNQNDSTSWLAHVAHRNFYDYYIMAHGYENIITVNDIVDDGAIYIYPVEICHVLNTIYNNYSIKLNGMEYTYNFIDTLDPKVLRGLQNGTVKLLLNYIHDPLELHINLNEIAKFFANYGIADENIIIVAGNTFENYYNEYPDSKIKITNGYIVLQQLSNKFNEYPRVGSLGYESDYVKPDDLDNHIRSKKFICLNRNMHRHHRWLSAYLALKYKLLDSSIFSFVALHNFHDWQKIYDSITNIIGEDDDIKCIVDDIMKVIPLEVDTHHLPLDQKSGFNLNNNNKELFAESYINIVSETSFERNSGEFPFISEKTFHHPIINLQPFIVIGNPFTLKKLRELGFKTFSPLINEEYDECIDFRQRFKLIESEISRLSALSLSEIHDIYYQLREVLIYNQNHAKTFGDYNPFEKTFNDIRKWYLK